jgi:predicted nucleotidyltransferase
MKWKVTAFLDIYIPKKILNMFILIEIRMDVLRSITVLTHLQIDPAHCERDEIMHKVKQIRLNHLYTANN